MAGAATVEFDSDVQSLDALNAAAYRLAGTASCQIERAGGRLICTLTPHQTHSGRQTVSVEQLRERFLDLVTDENVREQIAVKTEPVRNLILSLAFASLASEPNGKS